MNNLCEFQPDGDHYTCVHCGWSYNNRHGPGLIRECRQNTTTRATAAPSTPRPKGPGDYLHEAILRLTGEDYRPGCGCENMVRQMNVWGPAGCREHIDAIIAKMLEEAANRPKWKLAASLPGAKLLVKRMILSAIRKAESVGA